MAKHVKKGKGSSVARERTSKRGGREPRVGTKKDSAAGPSKLRGSREEQTVNVRVTHGDLAFAAYPVMVGHYAGDTIISAEKYLDRKLGYALSQRHQLGLYPGALETSAVFVNPDLVGNDSITLKGAIVIGLGPVGQLSAASLSRTVARALQEYVLRWPETSAGIHEHQENETNVELDVTLLLIGTGAGGIGVADAIRAMLLGIVNANKSLQSEKTNAGTPRRIRGVEFIELWEDRAIEAARAFDRLRSDPDIGTLFRFEPTLATRKGGMRRLSVTEPAGWWQRLQILGGPDDGSGASPLRFSSLTKRARSEVRLLAPQRVLIDRFVEQTISTTRDDSKIPQTLFELLLPNELKEEAPDQDNLVLVVDEEAAAYPWELLRDPSSRNGRPLAVQKGMLRQLETADFRPSVHEATGFSALVIGDPITRFVPLPGAQKEAKAVWQLFQRAHFDQVEPLIRPTATQVLNALFERPYRILHLAGHGVYDFAIPENALAEQPDRQETRSSRAQRKTGMVLSGDAVLSPTEIHQMRNVPELVFINCCHLGRIEGSTDDNEMLNSRDDYNRIAANVATEFIQIGVRAVVAAGWGVDDDAATTFATNFYQLMLSGDGFGEAVRQARAAVFLRHPGTNTWGAYQCYGDPDYRFHVPEKKQENQEQLAFVSPHEAAIELQNVGAALALSAREEWENYRRRLERIEYAIAQRAAKGSQDRTREDWSSNGGILAGLGRAYGELGEFAKAIKYYERAELAEDGFMNLTDIEQWGNLEIRYAVNLLSEAGVRDKQKMRKFEIMVDRGIKRLTSLKPTAERLSLVGSAYKRIALADSKRRPDALRQMIDNYSQAYAIGKRAGSSDPHAFLNGLAGEIALTLQTKKYNERRKVQLRKQLAERGAEIRKKSKGKEDFLTAVMLVDLELLQAITRTPTDFDKIRNLAGAYQETRKLANRREYVSVLDQIEFLRTMALRKNEDLASALALLAKGVY